MNKGIIFDVDGTLWDSCKELSDSWNVVLSNLGYDIRISKEEMRNAMGLDKEHIAAKLFPSLPLKEAIDIVSKCDLATKDYVLSHTPKVFEGLIDALNIIHYWPGVECYIVSNGPKDYCKNFIDSTHLGFYFEDYASNGDNGYSKAQNIRLIMMRNRLSDVIYIGDTDLDMVEANNAGVTFIHAAYGYRKVPNAKYFISSPKELPSIIKLIWNND